MDKKVEKVLTNFLREKKAQRKTKAKTAFTFIYFAHVYLYEK